MLKLEKIDTGEVRVDNGNLQEDKINNFIDDFGQQVKDIIMVKRAIKGDK